MEILLSVISREVQQAPTVYVDFGLEFSNLYAIVYGSMMRARSHNPASKQATSVHIEEVLESTQQLMTVIASGAESGNSM